MSNSVLWAALGDAPTAEINKFAMSERVPNSDLDRQAFLNLLMTQLKYQDPLNPMDDRDFMAQMAQFSALEQMMNLNHTFERTQAFSMIGRLVEYGFRHTQSGEWVEGVGIVDAVTKQGSDTFLMIEGMDVPSTAVRAVGDNPENPVSSVLNAVNQARIQDMVGRTVQALLHNDKGEVTDFVEGVVSHIKISGNQSVLVVGTREVFPWEVATVADGPILIGETNFTNGKKLTAVEIENGKAYLVFDDTIRVHVERINYAMEAIEYVNRHIQHGPVAGTVRSVTIRNGVPFFNVAVPTNEPDVYNMQEVSYIVFMADRIASAQAQAQQEQQEEQP